MLNPRRKTARQTRWSQPIPGSNSRVAAAPRDSVAVASRAGHHPLTDQIENQRLYDYEQQVKNAFTAIVPTLKRISAMQHEEDFVQQAQVIARQQLGLDLPEAILADAWVEQLDMRRLFAWCIFETYQRFSDDFFNNRFLAEKTGSRHLEKDYFSFLAECGFHTLDISPCADGRLAHVISYVLRLPYDEVRRKSYAGALFDIEDSLAKWTETEFLRFREGKPNRADEATRYLKTVVYHFSSGDPEHEGCAAHGSDTRLAAEAGIERLNAFQLAVQNSFCCGASIDLLLIGLDTDTDSIRVHIPDAAGELAIDNFIDTNVVYEETVDMQSQQAESYINQRISDARPDAAQGMVKLVSQLVKSNISQIDYVAEYYQGRYPDIGHAEYFIGAGIGFEEIQLRNLTYFAYMNTVEEATADLDVGVKIFTGLNVSHGLPIPIVIRFDYHGHVPGARERAVANCKRVAEALRTRYSELAQQGLLHTLLAIRDCAAGEQIEVLESTVNPQNTAGVH